MNELSRIPPHDIMAEESVLSACMMGYWQDPVDLLCTDDFYRTSHQKIFCAIEYLSKSSAIDLVSVTARLRETNELEECGGVSSISRLLNDVPAIGSIEHHCKIIKDKSVLRQIIKSSHDTINDCYSDKDAESILDLAQSRPLSIDPGGDSKTCEPLHTILSTCVETLEKRSKTQNKVTGIPTGITYLDYLLAGLQPSTLNILAARPSMGKSALAVQIAISAARHGFPVLILSLEMSKEQLGLRVISHQARIDSKRTRIGMVGNSDWEKINEANSNMYNLPIHIDDNGDLSMSGLRRAVRKAYKKYGVKLFIVDHMQLMKVDKTANRVVEFGDISRGCKLLAKEFNIPALLLSQLNRKVEERTDKRPMLSDLRESGAIEQDADVVMFLYRDAVYNKAEENPLKNIAEIVVAKQRDGPIGKIDTVFIGEYLRFEDKG